MIRSRATPQAARPLSPPSAPTQRKQRGTQLCLLLLLAAAAEDCIYCLRAQPCGDCCTHARAICCRRPDIVRPTAAVSAANTQPPAGSMPARKTKQSCGNNRQHWLQGQPLRTAAEWTKPAHLRNLVWEQHQADLRARVVQKCRHTRDHIAPSFQARVRERRAPNGSTVFDWPATFKVSTHNRFQGFQQRQLVTHT